MRQTKSGRALKLRDERVYTLEVFLAGGPVSEEFIKRNPEVSRTIQIRGSQTLEDLHCAIFESFDRHDEHMYEFQFGGKGPMDPQARRYVLPMAVQEGPFADDDAAGVVTRTRIDSLGLKIHETFGYWFDFGDDWWHQINVAAIEETPSGKYPRVIKRAGASPPQYAEADV
jgi:hypothetical protein